MMAWRRWQDWINVILGVILFIAAFVFAAAVVSAAEWTFIVIGVLLFLVGLYLLANPQAVPVEWVQIVLGILLFISPWVFHFSTSSPTDWFAWIIGVLAVIFAGWVLLEQRSPVART
jgi:uncharacterized membrane protein